MDFAFPDDKVAVEIEGLEMVRLANGRTVPGGRHVTFEGIREDMEKYASAALLGWRLVRFDRDLVKNGKAIDCVRRLIALSAPRAAL